MKLLAGPRRVAYFQVESSPSYSYDVGWTLFFIGLEGELVLQDSNVISTSTEDLSRCQLVCLEDHRITCFPYVPNEHNKDISPSLRRDFFWQFNSKKQSHSFIEREGGRQPDPNQQKDSPWTGGVSAAEHLSQSGDGEQAYH